MNHCESHAAGLTAGQNQQPHIAVEVVGVVCTAKGLGWWVEAA